MPGILRILVVRSGRLRMKRGDGSARRPSFSCRRVRPQRADVPFVAEELLETLSDVGVRGWTASFTGASLPSCTLRASVSRAGADAALDPSTVLLSRRGALCRSWCRASLRGDVL